MLVSFQANRNARFFRWLKYKEAFSAALAQDVIGRHSRPGEVVLDPFAGVGTAIFVARSMGRPSVGVELLPVGAFAVEARLSAGRIRPTTFRRHVEAASSIDWSARDDADFRLRHIPITRGAFPELTERGLAGYRAYCRRLGSPHVRRLFHLACLGILESVSYTRKDGQYLRWDCRANRSGVRSRFNKGRIAGFDDAIRARLQEMAADTRTYALELVYLGLNEQSVKGLRQSMLSCTVENAAKVEDLQRAYGDRGLDDVFERVRRTCEGQSALHEVLDILEEHGRRGDLNNANIPRMIRNYFLEMCFVVYELTRVLRSGGRVVMVNDNVRYAGQEVPVDLILSDFAASFGLHVEHIWTLARGKGNSSQQMGAHGRQELRKCVYVWRK
jgi:hypothetical protein